jgi:multimeric flavodoxin WrbA
MDKFQIAAVISSAHPDGNGARLVEEIIKGAEQQGAQVTQILLHQEKLNFCTGCNQCMAIGKCPIPDHFETVRSLLYHADGIIVRSPTFCGSMNAAMKNLFERLGMYERCTSMLSNKYVVAVSTASQESAARKTAKELATGVSSCLYGRSMVSGILGAGILPNGVSSNKMVLQKAFSMGEKLVTDINEQKKYRFQYPLNRLIMHRFVQPVMNKFIIENKEQSTKAVYANLFQRGLLR